MGVGVQREACGEVTQHAGYCLDVYTILEGDGGEGMAQVMESDLWDACPFQNTLQHIVHAVGEIGPPVGEGNTYSSCVLRFCTSRTSIASCKIATVR